MLRLLTSSFEIGLMSFLEKIGHFETNLSKSFTDIFFFAGIVLLRMFRRKMYSSAMRSVSCQSNLFYICTNSARLYSRLDNFWLFADRNCFSVAEGIRSIPGFSATF